MLNSTELLLCSHIQKLPYVIKKAHNLHFRAKLKSLLRIDNIGSIV